MVDRNLIVFDYIQRCFPNLSELKGSSKRKYVFLVQEYVKCSIYKERVKRFRDSIVPWK